MPMDFTPDELETILESLKYSKQRISDARDTAPAVRNENIARIDAAIEKVRVRVQGRNTSAKPR